VIDAGLSVESVAFTVTVVRIGRAWAELLCATTVEPNMDKKRINKKKPLSRERM
jgi:hypothetical protein